jgi:hypothetical protein
LSIETPTTLDQWTAILHIIEQTEALFQQDINWIRGADAVNQALQPVAPHSRDAVAWSLTGGLKYEDAAYIAYMRDDNAPEPTEPFPSDLAVAFLEQLAAQRMEVPHPVDLAAFNDRQGYRAVLRLLEAAGVEIAGHIMEAEES